MSKVFVTTCLLAAHVCIVLAIQKNSKASIIRQPFGYQICIRLCKEYDQCLAPKYISTELKCITETKGKMLESCDAKLATQNCTAGSRYSRAVLTRTKGLRSVKECVRKPDRYQSAAAKTFFMTSSLKTWDQGLNYCKARGGTLAMPETKADDRAIHKIILRNVPPSEKSYIFFGMRDIYENGTFLWADGQIPSYTNWAPGQPGNGGERCTSLYKSEGWHDVPSDAVIDFVCQKH